MEGRRLVWYAHVQRMDARRRGRVEMERALETKQKYAADMRSKQIQEGMETRKFEQGSWNKVK